MGSVSPVAPHRVALCQEENIDDQTQAIPSIFTTAKARDIYIRFTGNAAKVFELRLIATASLKKLNEQYDAVLVQESLNKVRYCNKLLEAINEKVKVGTLIMGWLETAEMRNGRLNNNGNFVDKIKYASDFFYHRVMPKLSSITASIYFSITRGEQRVFPKSEILGRLYACGYTIVELAEDNGRLFFIAAKRRCPAYDRNPSWGLLFRMRRVGKHGRIIHVYKLRTMHAYAEYLQEYIAQHNGLGKGGKFKDDFRVTRWGKWLRRRWIDELPMLINFFRGDMKLIGVRPISKQYFNLYSEEMKQLRIKFKPGILPPYYADIPQTLQEVMESEKRYLVSYKKHPLKTDFVYLLKIFRNIVFKRARSS